MSAKDSFYLRPDVIAEPLFNRWYAWPYLIAPASAAMYTANAHLKIMRSFVEAPEIHVAALKRPEMLGGPFLGCDPARAAEVKALADQIARERSHLVAFAEAVKALDKLLEQETSGLSLEPVYAKIPELLRGYVELFYDANNHASFRFLEGLLYRSRFYDKPSQSLSLLRAREDTRPFAFSTPRLAEEGRLDLPLPFDTPALDELFAMRRKPGSMGLIAEKLGVGASDQQRFASLFTPEPPPPRAPWEGPGARIRYFGHACLLFESRDTSVLIDPVISYHTGTGVPRYSFEDLPDTIDYVLLTHNHQDHVLFETLLPLRHKVRHVVVPRSVGGSLVDPSLKLILRNTGFQNVIDLEEMETLALPGGSITSVPFFGEHGDLQIRTKSAYVIELGGQRAFVGADSNSLDPALYEHVHALTGDVDLLFMGLECDGAPLSWLYGALMCKPLGRKGDQSRRLNSSDFPKTRDMVHRLNPREVYVYAMGLEPWLTHLTALHYTEASKPIVEAQRLIEHCRGQGRVAQKLYIQHDLILSGART